MFFFNRIKYDFLMRSPGPFCGTGVARKLTRPASSHDLWKHRGHFRMAPRVSNSFSMFWCMCVHHMTPYHVCSDTSPPRHYFYFNFMRIHYTRSARCEFANLYFTCNWTFVFVDDIPWMFVCGGVRRAACGMRRTEHGRRRRTNMLFYSVQ